MAAIGYADPFVERLCQDVAALVVDGAGDAGELKERSIELALANSPPAAAYWKRTRPGLGIPAEAYKQRQIDLFPGQPVTRVFRSSGTTGSRRSVVRYTKRGAELMRLSVEENARRHVFRGLDEPVVLRLVPTETAAPHMSIAHHLELMSRRFGHRTLSTSVVSPAGVDLELLIDRLDVAVAAQAPVVLLGASFAYVNVCDALAESGRRWTLPPASLMVDMGGFKGRSREVAVASLRAMAADVFGIALDRFVNKFGMTELASHLYDSADVPAGPNGERPKAGQPFAWPVVRDPYTLRPASHGVGLLEVTDLCLIDRPCVVLTGDRAIATEHGPAIAGRLRGAASRGCSLTADEMTAGASADVR